MSNTCVVLGCKRKTRVIVVTIGVNFYLCEQHNQESREHKPLEFKRAFRSKYYPEVDFNRELSKYEVSESNIGLAQINL